jgi:NhaA family Na+:H+ antiporter
MPIPPRRYGQLSINRDISFSTRLVELPAEEFIYRQGVAGILLLGAALLALAWANSPWASFYFGFWEAKFSFHFGFIHLNKSLHHWINDGLMTLFFFLVGMEIKHELVRGHLSSAKHAALPIIAAAGGMIIPASLFILLNWGSPTVSGWGVPMATDIAFAVGVMALLPGVSHQLKIFLLALAIVDDIGAILVIALFYSDTIRIAPLLLGTSLLVLIGGLRRAKVRFGFPYVLAGALFWLTILRSGIHATIAGVILAFTVSSQEEISKEEFEQRAQPLLDSLREANLRADVSAADADLGAIEALAIATDPPIERITRALQPWVSYVVMPLFAFANAGVTFSSQAMRDALTSSVFFGVLIGLVVGKPLGIAVFTWLSVRLHVTALPPSVRWPHIWGAGILAGIGFTVAIFIADLAFTTPEIVATAKIAILLGSLISGFAGYLLLRYVCPAVSLPRENLPGVRTSAEFNESQAP